MQEQKSPESDPLLLLFLYPVIRTTEGSIKMYGAILGDIIGSVYEFDRSPKVKEFLLFSRGSEYTDDSVMTIAVADALMQTRDSGSVKEKEILGADRNIHEEVGQEIPLRRLRDSVRTVAERRDRPLRKLRQRFGHEGLFHRMAV